VEDPGLPGWLEERAVNMIHWLHSLLPHLPRYGFVFVFIVIFLNNIGVPMPGKAVLFGAGFILGKTEGSLWQPMVAGVVASFLGGICAFWLGRRLGRGRLEKIHWLHLTPEKLKWPQSFLKRHGARSVFIARFVPFFPPVAVNLLAGMAKIRWQIFLFYNLAISMVCGSGFILLGYFFGKRWKLLEARLGPTEIYLSLAGMTLIVLGVVFRHSVSGFCERLHSKKRE
jgi:membrane protein DedA with SNARE-associated domain